MNGKLIADIAASTSMALVGAVGLWRAPGIWSGRQESLPVEPPEWWPYSPGLWTGVLRTQAFVPAVAFSMALAVLAAVVGRGLVWSVGPILLWLLSALVYELILFVGYPKVLIPPRWRAGEGAIAAWIRQRSFMSAGIGVVAMILPAYLILYILVALAKR